MSQFEPFAMALRLSGVSLRAEELDSGTEAAEQPL